MATPRNDGRQWPLYAVQAYSAVAADGDFVDATASAITIKLPPGAIVIGGGVLRTVVSNAAGTAVLDVGVTGTIDALLADANLKTLGFTAFSTGLGYVSDGRDVILTPAANTGATTGAGYVIVAYILPARANEVQTA